MLLVGVHTTVFLLCFVCDALVLLLSFALLCPALPRLRALALFTLPYLAFALLCCALLLLPSFVVEKAEASVEVVALEYHHHPRHPVVVWCQLHS